MTKITVHITKEVLEKTKNCGDDVGMNCAVAYAVNQLLPNCWVSCRYIRVYDRHNYLHNNEAEKLAVIQMPEAAQKFIMDFDNTSKRNRPSLPELSFDIDVPDEALQGINIDEVLSCCKTVSRSPQPTQQ